MYTHRDSVSDTIKDMISVKSRLSNWREHCKKQAKARKAERSFKQRLQFRCVAPQYTVSDNLIRDSKPGAAHILRNLDKYTD